MSGIPATDSLKTKITSNDPVPIPEEEDHVEPLPGPSCEPQSLGKKGVAEQVFPLLPKELKDSYVDAGKKKGKSPIDLLAWDLAAEHAKGGLNSREQRIKARVFDQHLNKYVTKDVVDWENVTRSEAYRFIAGWREFRGGRFGVPHTPLSTALATYVAPGQTRPILESIFFPNAPLAGDARRRSDGDKYEPITVTAISDGDTIKVRINRDGCTTEEGSIRFAGIDTPEKFRSDAKFWPQHEAVMADLVDRGLVKPGEVGRHTPLGILLANRMEYGGAVSSLIMKDFLGYALAAKGKFALEVTYNRVIMKGDEEAACDAASLYDVYLRGIWVLRVEDPSLITGYMAGRLVQVMDGKAPKHSAVAAGDGSSVPQKGPSDGVELWRSYQFAELKEKAKPEEIAKLEAAEKQIAKWRAEGRTELADLLDPAKIPQPSELYSKAGVAKIGEIWKGFVAKHPDRSGDVNAFMVGLGAAYAYTKYLNDMSGEYLSLGNSVKAAGAGLWGEVLVRDMDPNVRVLNKQTKRYEPYVMPEDCTK